MSNKKAKAVKNVAGKYYVDTNCISCGQCVDIASEFFAENSEGGMYVKSQPGSKEDIALCEQALSSCPVEAIGNDGE